MTGNVKLVAAAATPEALSATSTAVCWLQIQALETNTDALFVGGSSVTNANNKGIRLAPGDVMTVQLGDNLDNLIHTYVAVLVNGEGVRYAYVQR